MGERDDLTPKIVVNGNSYNLQDFNNCYDNCLEILSFVYEMDWGSFASDQFFIAKANSLEEAAWSKIRYLAVVDRGMLLEQIKKMKERKRMAGSIYDWIVANDIVERDTSRMTKEEWTEIRHTNDPDLISEAVERMEAQGGYSCLD